MAQLRMARAMGTSRGSTARISAVGASKTGFTSTNQSSPGKDRRWMSSGLQLLCPQGSRQCQVPHAAPHDVCWQASHQLGMVTVLTNRLRAVAMAVHVVASAMDVESAGPRSAAPDQNKSAEQSGGDVVSMVAAHSRL